MATSKVPRSVPALDASLCRTPSSVRYFPNGTPLSEMVTTYGTDPVLDDSSLSSSSSPCISVISYNLLAPLYVRPLDKRTGGIQPFAAFSWVQDDDFVLDWSHRRAKLLQILQSSRADVICLQELQLERDATSPEWVLPSWIRGAVWWTEYATRLPPSSELEEMAARNVRVLGEDAAVTSAVLYRVDRFREDEPDMTVPHNENAKKKRDRTQCVGRVMWRD